MPQIPLRVEVNLFDKTIRLFKLVPVLVFLSVTLIGFNMLQTASLLLFPFSRKAFRRFNRWGANTWWGWCVSFARMLHGAGVILSGDDVPMRENIILISNHQEMADIPFLMFFARMKDRLGDMKWFVKDIIKWIPGVGWGMLFLDCLFVKRRWADDRNSIEKTFKSINKGRVPIWLILFPEGTRVRPHKLEKSRAYAREKGLPLLEHLLLPRTKGFVASVIGLKEHVQAVYDVTIGYRSGVPTLWQYVMGYTRVAHLHIRRFSIKDLPEAGEALAAWLHERWNEKDKLLAYFYEHGVFPAVGTFEAAMENG